MLLLSSRSQKELVSVMIIHVLLLTSGYGECKPSETIHCQIASSFGPDAARDSLI